MIGTDTHKNPSFTAACCRALLTSSVLFTAVACGGTDPSTGDDGTGGTGGGTIVGKPFLPLAEGNRWVYNVTQDDAVTEKTTTVGALEPVGGSGPHAAEMAFKVVTAKGATGSDETVSWQATVGARAVRYREQAFGATSNMLTLEEHWSPPKLRVDQSEKNTTPGATWLEVTSETKLPVGGQPATSSVNDRWTVVADDVTLTVPAGTFENVLHIQKAGATSSFKEYWWARGVGKLKETGSQTEELVSYEVAP